MTDSKTQFDLDDLSVPELSALIIAAEAKRHEKMAGAKEALLADFKSKAAELGLSLSALITSPKPATERKPRRGKGEKVAPKYRNLETGDTWTGRGREPAWIKDKNREEFLV